MMDIYGDLDTLAEHLASRRSNEREYAARHNLARQHRMQSASLLQRILHMKRTSSLAAKATYTPVSTANA